MRIVMLGAPGSGKGTYTKRLQEHYPFPHISTGDLLRDNVKRGTDLGLKAKEYMDRGELVPDEIVIELLKRRLEEKDCEKGVFLDGFPRTIDQAKALEKIAEIHQVLSFDVAHDVIIERISGRRTCKNCAKIFHVTKIPPKKEGVCDDCGSEIVQRADEVPEVIAHRLKIYERDMAPLIEHYKGKNILSVIDANMDILNPKATIIQDCVKELKKHEKNTNQK
ncbi:MAG: adenylate kinase [Candidatus Nanoarchaeia archaeon]